MSNHGQTLITVETVHSLVMYILQDKYEINDCQTIVT